MPADFGDITAFHRQEAARHYALAQAARDRGSLAEAEYQAGMAARWDEVAQEQKIEMRQKPGPSIANQAPNRRPPEPQRISFAAACVLAVLRGAERIITAIRQPMSGRSAPFHGLSLH